MRTHHPDHVGTPTRIAFANARPRRPGSALLECLVALVLLEVTALLLVSAARTVAWSGRLDRFMSRASATVMAVSDSAAPQGCTRVPTDLRMGPVGARDGLAIEQQQDETNATNVAAGVIALPVPRVPRGALVVLSDSAMVHVAWQAAWWCMP